jgi:hypothetical protein
VKLTRKHLGHAAPTSITSSPPSAPAAFEDLNCDIEQGHLSAALCHLANISYRTGRTLRLDPAKETFPGDEAASKLLTRDYRASYKLPDPA